RHLLRGPRLRLARADGEHGQDRARVRHRAAGGPGRRDHHPAGPAGPGARGPVGRPVSAERRPVRTEHTRVVRATPGTLWALAAAVALGRAVFGPSVRVHHLERGPGFERFELWALVNGAVSSWVSRRALAPDRRSITFEQERSRAPIGSMGGEWLFRDLG